MIKYLLSVCIGLCIANISFAYTPSLALETLLDKKVIQYESLIGSQGDAMRDKIVSALQQIRIMAPSNQYRNIDQETFTFIISYLIQNLEKKSTEKILSIYDFPDSYAGFEIVQYPSQIVATVLNSGPLGQTDDDSFQNLAGFIFGDNSKKTEIAMTSPVTRTQLHPTMYETAFIMPSGWTLDSLPTPNNDRITIKKLPGSLKAVKRFSGRVNKDKVDAQRADFQQELTSANIKRYGLPTLSQYDGPRVSASSRRNELWVELNPRKFEF